MRGMDFWKLCDEYSIVQAALLACGCDPDEHQNVVERRTSAPEGYTAAKTAIYIAVQSGVLSARIAFEERDSFNQSPTLDPHSTFIPVSELDKFFRARGLDCPFFRRDTLDGIDQSLRTNPRFPKKLNAAIKAWTAVSSDPTALRGKSPKQALEKWLTEHAEELGLLNRDGKPNKGGIDEISKVANWKPEGGAVPTPSAPPQRPTWADVEDESKFQSELEDLQINGFKALTRRRSFPDDLDDEIPF